MSARQALENVRLQKLAVMRDIDTWRGTAQQLTHALGRVHPALLLGAGVLAGALVGRLAGKSSVSIKATSIALLGGVLQRRAMRVLTRALRSIQGAAASLATAGDETAAADLRSEIRGRQ